MMRRTGIIMLIAFFLFCGFPAHTSAAEMVSAVAAEYGVWSEWQVKPIQAADKLEVESQVRTVEQDIVSWTYNRYIYYNLAYDAWYAAAAEQVGDFVRAGSGYWEEHKVDEPLGMTGTDGADALFEGGWYNERAMRIPNSYESMMYRSRVVKRITGEVSATEVLLFPGDTRQLTVNLFDGSSGYFWTSTDGSVAVVDQAGRVTGVATGEARIWARSSKGREVSIPVLVCERDVKIPEGVYTLRLGKTNRTMAMGGSLGTNRNNVITQTYVGDRVQRFVLSRVDSLTFTLHPLNHRKWYVDIARRNKGLVMGANVQVISKKDRMSQHWRAIYVPDGSYILYPKADDKLVLGAEPEGGGNNIRLETMADLEVLDRWVLVKTNQSLGVETPFIRPLARDGKSYVAAEFGVEVGEAGLGMQFESNGRRVFVLAAARGKVKEVGELCGHDYPKAANAEGKFIDPCSLDAYCPGNYIVIDHGGGVSGTYAHLSEVYVKVGDTVRQGTMLGRTGATGSTGSVKLSFELWFNGLPVNPREYIKVPDLREPIN